MTSKIVKPNGQTAEVTDSADPTAPAVGRWYMVKNGRKKDGSWLACVVRMGSNYLKVEGVHRSTQRIHFKDFYSMCEFVPEPDALIDAQIRGHQASVQLLLAKVHQLTARLSIGGPELRTGSETQALALHGAEPVEKYKAALVKAQKDELPELFKEIETQNREMGEWMKAKLIPFVARAGSLDVLVDKIKDRIFSVELYAGLVERVVRVRDGEPAELPEKVRLMQRRAYMDEESLAQYETGGMDFSSIEKFDAWIARDDNMARLLPFPRCVLAFKVRRNAKFREAFNMSDYMKMLSAEEADKLTFLYLRNGEQLYRMSTELEFDEKLFPDMAEARMNGDMWARLFAGQVQEMISQGDYEAILEKERLEEEERKKLPKKDQWIGSGHKRSDDYQPFKKESVYYDDMAAHLEAKAKKHNRLVLVLQGLLDRSPVFHPHPAWQLWTEGGFTQALALVYDDTRTLTPGDKPDFEAYRKRLNESLAPGCVTVGQEDQWLLHEGKKECDRIAASERGYRTDYRPTRHHPYGNPGPGKLARVASVNKKTSDCTYAWDRLRQGSSKGPAKIRCTFTARASRMLNVSAYKPGDFRQFFNDPRTRADYLRWAPLMLEAEEYHAGNRKVADVPPPAKPLPKTDEGQDRYRMRKERRALMQKAVRLLRQIETQGGHKYKVGSLWRVIDGSGRSFEITGCAEDGSRDEPHRAIRGVSSFDFRVDSSIPRDPLDIANEEKERAWAARRAKENADADDGQEDE